MFDPMTAKYRRRAFDNKYEIYAQCQMEGHGWVTLGVHDTHEAAIEHLKTLKQKG